jgi:septum formation protein
MRIEVFVPDVDEAAIRADSLRAFVLQAAAAKAEAVRANFPVADDPRPIIAADTIVVLDGRALGKPRDRDDARAMLRALSGRTHEVLTGLALGIGRDGVWVDAERSAVTFRELDRRRPSIAISKPARRTTRPAPTASRKSARNSSNGSTAT